jgi:hypothetical protein
VSAERTQIDGYQPTAEFLAAVWGNGPHSVCRNGSDGFRFAFAEAPDDLLAQLPRLQGFDVWISAHPLRAKPEHGRGTAADIAEVVALHADLDWAHVTRRTSEPLPSEAEVRERLAKLGDDVGPSIVVNSGHGLQAWWLLTWPVEPVEEAMQLMAQLDAGLEAVGLVNGRSDLASILRLPGTLNHKGDPLPVVIEALETGRRFTPQRLRKCLPPAKPGRGSGGGTRHTPGAVTDGQQALLDFVVKHHDAHGVDVWRDGSIHVTRPGKPEKDGSSASIIVGKRGDALLTVFSDHWPGLSPGSYAMRADGTELCHPNDFEATVRIEATSSPARAAVSLLSGNLPDEFWNGRPLLAALRSWAHAQAVAADSVYAVVRARLAVLVDPAVKVDTGILTPVSLNLLTVLLGASGAGKTTAANLGPQVVDWGRRVDVFEVTLGSGEGMADAYLGPASKGAPRSQVFKGGLFTLDEGQALHDFRERSGSTLMSELRKAFSGTTLGQHNAGRDTKRQVRDYRFSLLANMQPSVAARLLGDHENGDPQRFTWFATTDPNIPDAAPVVPVPQVPVMTHGWTMTVPASITAELRARRLAVARGEQLPDPLDSQRPACQAKEAGMLALLDSRTGVTEEDWRLAGMVMDVSDVLRRRVMRQAQARRQAEDEARGKAQGVREAAASTEKERRLILNMAERIRDRLPVEGIGRGELSRSLTSKRNRRRFDPALDLAMANGWVNVADGRVVPQGGNMGTVPTPSVALLTRASPTM